MVQHNQITTLITKPMSNNSNNNPMSNNQNNPTMQTQYNKQMNAIINNINERISSLIDKQTEQIELSKFIEMLDLACYLSKRRYNVFGDIADSYEQPYEDMFTDIATMCHNIAYRYEEVIHYDDMYISKVSAMEYLSSILNHCNDKAKELVDAAEPKAAEPKREIPSEETIRYFDTHYKQKYDELLTMFKAKMKEIDDMLSSVGRSIDRLSVSDDEVSFSIYNREICIDSIDIDKCDVEESLGNVQELVEEIQYELAGKEDNNA